MIHPLIPYGIRGVIWYQGEANSGRPAEYGPLFSAMITDWRRKFEQESLPFYFVQLANFEPKTDKGGEKLAFMREAQAEALALAETGMAVTIDIGTPSNIHPPNKQDVGARLARLAKAKVYGLDITWSGPRFQSARREQGARVRVYLDDADGLQSRNEPVKAFELAGSDGRFFPAQGAIDGGTVILETPEVPDPHFVRYAWSNSPEVNLTNGEGLPAVPFKKTAVTRE